MNFNAAQKLLAIAVRTALPSLPLASFSLFAASLYAVESTSRLSTQNTPNQPEANLLPTITIVSNSKEDGAAENGYAVKQLK